MSDREEPLVTIAIPCFNEERYIEQCIEDLFAQDYPASQIEILVGDGMSTDRTREILNRLAAAKPGRLVGSSRVDLQACKLEYSIVSPK